MKSGGFAHLFPIGQGNLVVYSSYHLPEGWLRGMWNEEIVCGIRIHTIYLSICHARTQDVARLSTCVAKGRN